MGTNISKGLKDRRSRSSTSLYKGKNLRPGKLFTPNRITRQERYKFSGSLPNFLDIKSPPATDYREREIYADNNNESKDGKLFDIGRFEKYDETLTKDYNMCFSEKTPVSENEKRPVAPKRRLSSKRTSHNKSVCVDDATFDVSLNKGHGGLGLSVSGGKSSDDQSCGVISIKKLFPHQAAWQSGRLQVGDFLLAVNGVPLTGLTNFEALEVLRKSANPVILTVRRPLSSQPKSPELQPKPPEPRPKSPEPPDQNDSTFDQSKISSSSPPSSLPPNVEDGPSEFEITLKKVNGSLGFTLRKEDGSVLGHYVRALVKEPALSDGRIKPGDRIVSVNGVDLSALSHEKAVTFLRQCGEEVHLRLFRDPSKSQAPSYKQPKPILRKEAIEMLSDLKRNESSPSNTRQRSKSALTNSRDQIKKSGFHSNSEDPNSIDDIDGSLAPEDSYAYNPFQHDSLIINNPNFGTPGSLDLSQVPEAAASMPPILNLDDSPPEFSDAPASMPPAILPPDQNEASAFSHGSPAYQSTHLLPSMNAESRKLSERSSEHDLSSTSFAEESKGGLLKWKGVMFTPEDQEDDFQTPPSLSPPPSFNDKQLIKVELVRSWNSRLGFSLTSSRDGEGAVVSTIHPNSIAAKNGQLQNGDNLVKVNEEDVTILPTSEVIEMLRRVRGAVILYIHRQDSSH